MPAVVEVGGRTRLYLSFFVLNRVLAAGGSSAVPRSWGIIDFD